MGFDIGALARIGVARRVESRVEKCTRRIKLVSMQFERMSQKDTLQVDGIARSTRPRPRQQ